MWRKRQGVFAFALFVFPLCLNAQDSTSVVPIAQLEVTVTRGSRPLAQVPAAVSVVGGEQIQRAQLTVGLEEALAAVPGVVVNNRYNFALGSRISIRGFGARAAFGVRGVRLIADGIPLTMPDGQANLNNIDLASVGRIEVLRGAASMLHGNAAGGVVSIETERPAMGVGGELRIAAGDVGSDELDNLRKLSVKAATRTERSEVYLSGSRLETEGYRVHSRAQQNNVNGRGRYTFTDRSFLALTVNIADAPEGQNPGSLPRDSAELKPEMAWPRNAATRSGESSRQVQAGIEYFKPIGSARLNTITYFVSRTLDNPLPFAYITLDRIAGGFRSAVSGEVRALSITAGVDLELQSDDRAEFDNNLGTPGSTQRRDQTDRISSIGPFAQLGLAWSERLHSTIGLRYDRAHFDVHDRFLADGRDDSGQHTMSALSPSFGLTFSPTRATTLFASISTSFQTPTTTEMINLPPAPGEPCCAAGFNPLDPQRALSYEAGVRGALGTRLAYEAAAYHTNIRDALVPFQVPQADGREFFRNAGRTRHRGIELAATAIATSSLALTTSYTYSDFIFEDDGIGTADFEGNRVPGVAPHHVFARVSWRPVARALVETEIEHTSEYYAADSNSAVSLNPAATIVDLRLAALRGPGGVAPFIGINNLFDERYFSSVVINATGDRYFEPAPGRNIYFGVSTRFGSWR